MEVNARVLVCFFFFASSVSVGCTEEVFTTGEAFEMADHVVLARVLSTRIGREGLKHYGFGGKEFVEALYETMEIFKGDDKSAIAREVIQWSTNCSQLPLLPGSTYFLFIDGDSRRVQFTGPDGSHPLIDAEYQNEELLQLRALRDQTGNEN